METLQKSITVLLLVYLRFSGQLISSEAIAEASIRICHGPFAVSPSRFLAGPILKLLLGGADSHSCYFSAMNCSTASWRPPPGKANITQKAETKSTYKFCL